MSVQTWSVSCWNEGSLLSLKRLSSATAACYENDTHNTLWAHTCDNDINSAVMEKGAKSKGQFQTFMWTDKLILQNWSLYFLWMKGHTVWKPMPPSLHFHCLCKKVIIFNACMCISYLMVGI